jgi:hypothetical protein
MARGDRRKCKCCRKLFRPDPRNRRHQRYCAEPPCRAASKAASHTRWLSKPENQNYFRAPWQPRSRDLFCWDSDGERTEELVPVLFHHHPHPARLHCQPCSSAQSPGSSSERRRAVHGERHCHRQSATPADSNRHSRPLSDRALTRSRYPPQAFATNGGILRGVPEQPARSARSGLMSAHPGRWELLRDYTRNQQDLLEMARDARKYCQYKIFQVFIISGSLDLNYCSNDTFRTLLYLMMHLWFE